MSPSEMATNWINGNRNSVIDAIREIRTPVEGFLACEALRGMLPEKDYRALVRRLGDTLIS